MHVDTTSLSPDTDRGPLYVRPPTRQGGHRDKADTAKGYRVTKASTEVKRGLNFLKSRSNEHLFAEKWRRRF